MGHTGKKDSRLLFTDYNGIGNAFILIPILRELERTSANTQYFCLENPVFAHPEISDWAGLRGPQTLVPAIWRRFDPQHWPDITYFLVRHQVQVVVNLRNEELTLDRRYLDYQTWLAERGLDIDFWDLYDRPAAQDATRCSAEKTVRLLRRHGLPLGTPEATWLRGFGQRPRPRQHPSGTRVGFFVGASQRVKRWPSERWIELTAELCTRLDRPTYEVLAGLNADELALARAVSDAIATSGVPVRLVEGQDFLSFIRTLCGLDLLVSNDSAAVHIAAAAAVHTCGLYLASLASIWGPRSERARSVQSEVGKYCPHMKPAAGSCRLYYTGCPAPCQRAVTARDVADEIYELLPFHPLRTSLT